MLYSFCRQMTGLPCINIPYTSALLMNPFLADMNTGFPRLLESPGFFFLENSRTWKVLENHFGPGKSWKLKLKVLESPGKISLKVMHFSSDLNGKQAAIV